MNDFLNKLNILYKKAQEKGFITYKEINETFQTSLDTQLIEEIFSFFEKFGIPIYDKNLPDTKYKKIENTIDNLIDTPEKFYFWEIKKISKTDTKKDLYLSKKISDIKCEIKNLIITTPYFLKKLLSDFYQIKKSKLNYCEIFNNNFVNFSDFEKFVEKIKNLYKEKVKLSIKKIDCSEINQQIFSELKNAQIKFSYIKKCLDELERNIKKLKDKNEIFKWLKINKITLSEAEIILNKYQSFIRTYEKIKNDIITSKLPLVMSIAKYYNYKGVLSPEDIIQEGNLALIEALEKYDFYCYKKTFSQYASYWIRKKLASIITENNNALNLTNSLKKEIKTFLKAVYKLRNIYFRNPTVNEIAEELNWSKEKVKNIFSILKKPVSLNSPVNDLNTLQDLIADNQDLTPTDIAIENIMKEKINEAILYLSDIERDVISLKFGLHPIQKEYSYNEISKILDLSVEKIKEYEQSALKKLKKLCKQNHLEDFL